MFYAAMTHCTGHSCTLHPMRISIYLLLVAGLAVSARAESAPALVLEAATDRTIYPSDRNSPIYVEAKILAPVLPGVTDTSVRNIAFVFDRSGSMAGEPIQALRQALMSALGMLAERDIVSIVLFGSEAETVVPAQRRDQVVDLEATLARIEPAGGSALYDAINQGAAQLRRYAASATINHLVLVTDGPATKGPRERDDFTRLAELFAREGISLSTIGLGEEFEEDLMVAMARSGNGRFRYAAQPDDLSGALQTELALLRIPVAREVVLCIEYGHGSEEVETSGWEQAEIDGQTATYRFPYVFAGQEVGVLAGASTRVPWNAASSSVAVVRLRWKDVATGAAQEAVRKLNVYFDADTPASQKSIDRGVMRAAVNAVISEGMQRSIEQLDKGDFRRALRELRRTRDRARDMNYELEDGPIAAKIQVLEAYLTEVRARGLNQLDRKILRSGLHNQFDIPTAEPKAD